MNSLVARCLLVLFAIFGIFSQITVALPIADLEARDVYVPHIKYPHSGVVWTKGEKHNVTWDTTNPPKSITNRNGTIILRHKDMATPLILAKNFDILLGKIEIVVPWVVTGDEYSIVLFGDSGNWSDQFTIDGSQ